MFHSLLNVSFLVAGSFRVRLVAELTDCIDGVVQKPAVSKSIAASDYPGSVTPSPFRFPAFCASSMNTGQIPDSCIPVESDPSKPILTCTCHLISAAQ
jgi:hypothetical protein